ncbi:type II toxin-antitoxin system RelE/ParE family toxin [Blastopirellula sp. J2-11]|uniref:type II toxin-antitoxin system RelE/ParE family toxin n=1 Tax=Blastopirellula sp. J2-11 TaxID=2943192 RepID=UPI0021C9681B|nr:type II toxin-antitoxin system RelE/ParE family toxin [Blastopirellula sp. J2-11]UUO07413.1 type II toxin-antitoxin system RelE/ParE family toxin [Blastopirellula sp. J2-11]
MFYQLSAAAESDLDAIVNYLFGESPVAASKVFDDLTQRFELLSTQPLLGEVHPGPRHFRRSIVGNYVVFYVPLNAGIEIARILHGNRDITALLR